MLTIETVAEIGADGVLVLKAPVNAKPGKRRVRVEIDDESSATERPRLPDWASFRARLGADEYPGNTILEMRDEERS